MNTNLFHLHVNSGTPNTFHPK